jgi:hypothetical protein
MTSLLDARWSLQCSQTDYPSVTWPAKRRGGNIDGVEEMMTLERFARLLRVAGTKPEYDLLSTVSRQPRSTSTCARTLQASEINSTG